MDLPDLYVGKIVDIVEVSYQVYGRHLPAIVVRIADEGLNRIVLTFSWHHTEDGHRAGAT